MALRRFESWDYEQALSLWYDKIKHNGTLAGLGKQVGNYNAFYRTLIALMCHIPIPKLYAYKILSGIFDLVLAFFAAKLAWVATGKQSRRSFVLTFGIVFLSPVVVLNSGAWAQCDSMWASMCLATLFSC
ncbi:MAG: hypothetical protein IKF78_10480 [Atopobiaceae bacterium]|nr:hypothetical protein [Atopobiaceae bacterium]